MTQVNGFGNNAYLQEWQAALNRIDKNGNGDGKVNISEAFQDLDIGSLIEGQDLKDTFGLLKTAIEIPKALFEYAGEDGEFSAEEWHDFINGDEWGAVLDVWHNSGKMAEIEMGWIDQANINDGKVYSAELKVGILNNLIENDIEVDTTNIESIIDEYAGEDSAFTKEEYQAMKKNEDYNKFLQDNRVEAWFNAEEVQERRVQEYLAEIEEEVLTEIDANGNGDGKVDVDEAVVRLDIAGLVSGQNTEDTKAILSASENITDVLKEYAGEDGEFSAQEWHDFINGDEWGAVLEAWHNSGKMAELEMNWTDNAHIKDGAVTKGEIKVGLMHNLSANGKKDVDTTSIEKLIDKYAGADGTFTKEEYMAMKQDEAYSAFVEKYGITPWFSLEEE